MIKRVRILDVKYSHSNPSPLIVGECYNIDTRLQRFIDVDLDSDEEIDERSLLNNFTWLSNGKLIIAEHNGKYVIAEYVNT